MAQINLLAPFHSSVTLGRFPRYAQSSGWLTPLLHGWAEFFCKAKIFSVLGTANPSVDLRIPDENFALQNSRFPVQPHPNEHNNDSARCDEFFLDFSDKFEFALPKTHF